MESITDKPMGNRQPLGIVLIHGAGLGAWIWRDVTPLIDIPALAINLPKRDGSFEERKSLTLDEYSADVVQQIEKLETKKVIIVAHSLGGVIALKVANALGDRIVGFVAVSAAIPANGGSFMSILPFPTSLLMQALLRIFGTKPPKSAIVQGLGNDLSPEQQQEVVERFVPESRYVYTDRSETTPPHIKSLFIKLTQDQEFPVSEQDKMIAHLYSPKVITMDTGHLPMLKEPKRFAEILNEFVGSINK